MKFSELNKKREEASLEEKKIKARTIEKKEETASVTPPLENPHEVLAPDLSLPNSNKQVEEKKASQTLKEEKQEIKFTIKREEKVEDISSNIIIREEEFKESAKTLYFKSVSIMKDFYGELDNTFIEKYFEIRYLVDGLYKELDENPFFPLILKYLTPANYLLSHSLNTSIISIGIAKQLNIPDKDVRNIGIAALFHDIGMRNYMSLARKEAKLSKIEMGIIQKHVQDGIEKLDSIIDFEHDAKLFVSDILMKVHERYDGFGYPLGLSGEKIDLYSSIIAVADVYEALSHRRPWRAAYELPAVIRTFISDFKESFHPKALKGLISFFSMYPIGSLIKLSTGEIGMVEVLNKKNFAKPIIRVIMDSEFNSIENFYINLIEHPLTQIEGEVKYKELKARNPKFLSDFEMSSLWIEW